MLDAYIGMIIKELEQSARDAIVVFTSDNGAPTLFTEDGRLSDHSPNGRLRGQKADIHDGGHRVPLIIAGPGVPVGVDDTLVGLMDLYPSLAESVGVRLDDSCPSLDGRPVLFPTETAAERVDRTNDRVLGVTALDGSLALMRGGQTTIWTEGSGGFTEPKGAPTPVGGSCGQFYDRTADPQQRHDLWQERSQERTDITEAFVAQTGYSQADEPTVQT